MSKKNQEEKVVEYCVVTREVAEQKLKEVVENNKNVFDEYRLWSAILNSPVTLTEEVDVK